MLGHSDPDLFWSVKHREDLEIEQLQARLNALSLHLEACRKLEAIRNQPGFTDFTKSVQALREEALKSLVEGSLTDPELRQKRGEVQAFEKMIALMVKPTMASTLASQVAACQDALQAAKDRRPIRQRSE